MTATAASASALDCWRRMVEAHEAQAEGARRRAGWPEQDSWRAFEAHFRADPSRTGDPVLARLLRAVDAETTVLDVGGGAGRFALPLARSAARVTVVEPSESMASSLREGASEIGVDVAVVQGPWETATVEPADLVLCANVVHAVADLEPFVRKLEAHALDRVWLIEPFDGPVSFLAPFWERVHHEPFALWPGVPELMQALWELDIRPSLEMLEPVPEAAPDIKHALVYLRQLLYVMPGSELDAALEELAETSVEGVALKGARPRRLGFMTWRPDRAP